MPRFGDPMSSATLGYSEGGPTRTEVAVFPLAEFTAAEDRLDVQTGPVSVTGDLETLHIQGEVNGLAIDITFEQLATPLRFGSGYYLVGSPERFRGWFNAFPKATATGTFTVDGEEMQIEGTGYHDHNWGNFTAGEAIVGWLWARADFGRYVALAVRDQVRARFGGEQDGQLWIYDLQEGKELVRSFGVSNPNLTVTEGVFVPHPDPLHGAGFPTLTVYNHVSGEDRATVVFRDSGVLAGFIPYDIGNVDVQQFLRENDTNGLYYTRRTSDVRLDLDLGSQGITDHAEGPALHELMESYFPQYIPTK